MAIVIFDNLESDGGDLHHLFARRSRFMAAKFIMQNCLAKLADLFAKDGLPDERMLIAVSAPLFILPVHFGDN
jgi:hypothetical protein